MRFLPERTLSSLILLASLAVILVALAVLQYRWSGQVSTAEKQRMQTSLLASTNQFRLQLNNELRQLGFLMQPDPAVLLQRDWRTYAARCDALLNRPDHRLIRTVYLWVADDRGRSQLLRLSRSSKDFEAVDWPGNFKKVRERYGRLFVNVRMPEPGLVPFRWTIISEIPLMVQPLLTFRSSPDARNPNVRFAGCLLLELNQEMICGEVFPQLARKYFEGRDGFIYQIAVVNRRDAGTILYRSEPHLTIASFAAPDARIELFERQRMRFGLAVPALPQNPAPPAQGLLPAGPANIASGRGPAPPEQARPRPALEQLRPGGTSAQERADMSPILFDGSDSGWELVAKHRDGSLEVAVDRIRRRNLAISLGSLLLLALSMALILASARRAQRLARLQIDFVAGISHELRTPLAVICSAGDNLAEGVTDDSSNSTRKYGELIRDEGRKLTAMIERILQFASLQRMRSHFNLRPENINEVAASALAQLQAAIAAAGFTVEKTFAPGLPLISVDAAALSRVIQNLIQNAIKYSGDSRWLAVRTAKAEGKRKTEVQLIIEDRGVGIDSEDLPQIFKPFYRGSVAAAAQIHGTGLGLFIVREALNSMGGKISVKSTAGKGSVFTLHFSALPPNAGLPMPAASEDGSKNAV